MPKSADPDRGATLPTRGDRVRRALPRRTQPPGTRESAHLGPAGYRENASRATPFAARWLAQLLSAGRMIIRSAAEWNISRLQCVLELICLRFRPTVRRVK